MSADTRTPCDSCGRHVCVVVVTSVRVHKRWVQWKQCVACYEGERQMYGQVQA